MNPKEGEHPSSHQHSTSTEGKHEWKQRPPYRVHEDPEGFDVKYEASCHCGKVKYQLSREEPLDSKLCHCTTCQTQHGMFLMMNRIGWADANDCLAAPFQWAAIFHKEDINFTHGHHNLEWYVPLPSPFPLPFSSILSKLTLPSLFLGTTPPTNPSSTSSPAKCAAPTATRRSWTKAAT